MSQSQKRCHWCGAEASGTAPAALYDECGRFISNLGGRYASCGEHGSAYYRIPPVQEQP